MNRTIVRTATCIFLAGCAATPTEPKVADEREVETADAGTAVPPGRTTEVEAGEDSAPSEVEPAQGHLQIPRDPSAPLPRKPSKHDGYQIPNSVVVCSWNIKWFGQASVAVYDFVTMADFVEECDVIALQELKSPNHDAVVSELLTELTNRNHAYDSLISPETGYANNPNDAKKDYVERFAFLWEIATIKLKRVPHFVSTPAINNLTFRQVPWVADFEVKDDNGFDFRVLSTHTVYKKQLQTVRKAELQAIHDWLSAPPADGEENLIAIGDFNANPRGQTAHFASIIKTNPLYRIAWYESAAADEMSVRTTVPLKDSSSSANYPRLPLYDQILVTSKTSYALGGEATLTLADHHFGVWDFDNDPWWKANGWTRQDVVSAVSDHRPIWIRLVNGAEDRD